MADHALIPLPKNTVVRLTKPGESIASFSFTNDGEYPFRLLAGTEASPPSVTDMAKGFKWNPGTGDDDKTIAGMFPGIPGANVVFAWSDKPTRVIFSYA